MLDLGRFVQTRADVDHNWPIFNDLGFGIRHSKENDQKFVGGVARHPERGRSEISPDIGARRARWGDIRYNMRAFRAEVNI